jgi:Domain of unknown function (DUF5668)
MNRAFEIIRAVRGPVLLMAVGALLALEQFDKWGFERSWPVLFILFGVLKLAERLVAPPAPVPPYHPQAYPPQAYSTPSGYVPPQGPAPPPPNVMPPAPPPPRTGGIA